MRIAHPVLDVWAITKPGLQQLAEFYALRAKGGEPLKNTYEVAMRDGVAVIPIHGPLVLDAGYWPWLTTYETLRRDFQSALDNPDVRAILFDVDSPGGQANGCGELSTVIYNSRGIKPVEAYVQALDCSAAYEITSACDRIHIDPSAVVGSIGVKTLMVSYKKFLASLGIEEHELASDQSPLKIVDPDDPDDRARVKQMLTDMAAVFVDIVARNRGVTTDKVLKDFGRGDVLVGKASVDAGLADEMSDFETVLAGLAGERTTRSFAMTTPRASVSDTKCDGCGRAMDDDDDTYCRACHSEADAMRSALGVDAGSPVGLIIGRITALIGFERDVLAATGATTAPAAIGKVTAGVAAIGQLVELRAAADKERTQSTQRQFRACLDDKRLTLAHLATMVPTFLSNAPGKDGAPSERAKVKTAIAALPAQTREGLVAAIAIGAAAPESLEQLQAFTEALGPGSATELPIAHREAPLDEKHRTAMTVATKEQLAAYGVSPEAFEKFASMTSVAGIVGEQKSKG